MPKNMSNIATDSVLFTVMNDDLKILLIKRLNPPFKGSFALPGGYLYEDEGLEDCAKRELYMETNVKDVFLLQLGAYGGVKRDPRNRVVTVAFMALVNPSQELMAKTDAAEAQWVSVYDVPELAFDHNIIVNDALERLRYEIQTTNIAFQILPKRFTLSQMQRLYELVLNKELDKRNFRKKVFELDIIAETSETMMEGAHRPARLYRFKSSKYQPISAKVNVFLK